MKGSDLINSMLPDELIMDVFQRLEAKSDCDTISLVCRRWTRLERTIRRTIKIGASGPADRLVEIVVDRFKGLRNFFVDERLPVSPLSPSRSPPARRRRHSSPPAECHHVAESSESEETELERLSLSDAGMASLAKGCKGLEKLSLIWCSSITSLGLTTVAENCKTLKSLDLQKPFCYWKWVQES